MNIPVWHDDQQGSATAVLAGLTNALKVVGKPLAEVRIAMIGIGAAGVPTYRLLIQAGANPQHILACDRGGILHQGRGDLRDKQAEFPEKWSVCQQSNGEQHQGGIAQALVGADVCVAFSRPGPGVIRPEWLRHMAPDAIVFACANPVPEIWPSEAREAGVRIVATGRSDFPNQVNNSLVFPAIFRGALDVRARTITDGMAMAAAHELAAGAEERGLREDQILPTLEDWQVFARVAVATALQAEREEVARCPRPADELRQRALDLIQRARHATRLLDEAGLIGP
jgi:malate dehydrogenase (oxaloacetate-decarboxylating)